MQLEVNFFIFTGAPAFINLGFGNTSPMSLSSSQNRLALLEAAFDAGIRHFDTALYYGYVEAERILGDFIVGKRDQFTNTTKIWNSAASRKRPISNPSLLF